VHDVLRQRLLRCIESLPEAQVYQVLDFIEFLESKYARDLQVEVTGLQRFAEGLEDKLRKKAVSPSTIREAFQLIADADRVLSSVSTAGRQILTSWAWRSPRRGRVGRPRSRHRRGAGRARREPPTAATGVDTPRGRRVSCPMERAVIRPAINARPSQLLRGHRGGAGALYIGSRRTARWRIRR